MPGMAASFGASSRATSSALRRRSPRGLRRMLMRPWFIVPPPTEDMKWATLGSAATTAATCCWCATMAS